MQIYVVDITGKSFSFDVEPNESVESVKQKIHDKIGYPLCVKLRFGSRDLEFGHTLTDYGIPEYSFLHTRFVMYHSCKFCCPSGTVFVKTVTGKTFPLTVRLFDDPVKKIKQMIREKEGILPDSQNLVFEEIRFRYSGFESWYHDRC